MASIASTKNQECIIFFNSGDCSKEGRKIAYKLLQVGSIGVNEGDRDGGVAFVGGDRGGEPPGWVDESKAFTDRVAFQFVDEGGGGCWFAFGIPFDRDAVDDDFGEAVLGDETSAGPEGSGKDGLVAVDHVVRRLSCKGKDKVVVQAQAPVTGEEGHLGGATSVGLIDGGADGTH